VWSRATLHLTYGQAASLELSTAAVAIKGLPILKLLGRFPAAGAVEHGKAFAIIGGFDWHYKCGNKLVHTAVETSDQALTKF